MRDITLHPLHPQDRVPAADGGQRAPLQIIESLQSVLADVDRYLAQWSERLDQPPLREAPSIVPAQRLQEQINDFQREQHEWTLQREREDAQIREKFEQLTLAWLHLEAEQRKVLQMKLARTTTAGETSSTSASPLPTSVKGSRPQPLSDGGHEATVNPPTVCDSIGPQTHPATDNAVRQFQKLRKEIQSNRRFEV